MTQRADFSVLTTILTGNLTSTTFIRSINKIYLIKKRVIFQEALESKNNKDT
jgi:hypothetical protein